MSVSWSISPGHPSARWQTLDADSLPSRQQDSSYRCWFDGLWLFPMFLYHTIQKVPN